MDDRLISDAVAIFTEDQWHEFMLNQLGMQDAQVAEIEDQNLDFEPFKLEVVKKWSVSESLDDAIRRLRDLKCEYFCDSLKNIKHSGRVSEPVEPPNEATRLPANSASGKREQTFPIERAYQFKGGKGQVLIISNSGKPQYDEAEIMKKLWIDEFKCTLFKSAIQRNKTAREMKQLFGELAGVKLRPAYVVVIVISYVKKAKDEKTLPFEEYLTGNHGSIVKIGEITNAFRNMSETQGKILQNVPKIFIFSGCRGIPLRINEGESNLDNQTAYKVPLLPTMSDMLCIYPPITKLVTGEGSFQRATNAGRFIGVIDDVFRKYGKNKHVVDIVKRLNGRMTWMTSEDEERVTKKGTMSRGATFCLSSLTRKLFLFENAIPENLREKS